MLPMHVGLIIPSSNTVMEEELSRYVRVHSTRISLTTVDEDSLKKMNEDIEKALMLLADCSPDVIVYGCTSGSFVEDIEDIFEKSAVPVVTTSGAVVSALHTLGAQTISVATPYVDDINQKEKRFLEAHGFCVKDMKGLSILDNKTIGKQKNAYDFVKSLKRADAIFVSCTNFRTFDCITRLEEELSVPVVSSNSASLWGALRLAHKKCPIPLGRLLEEFV
jgi:maleate isomerase